MKAVVFTEFGGPEVLRIQDVEQPVPGDRDVLIKVHATTVTAAESLMRRGRPLWGRVIIGFLRPRRRFRVLGLELSGEVVSVGARARRFSVGDEVFGFTSFGAGACAEYIRDLIEAGKLTIVVDRRYALTDIVAAHRYVETGHKRGNVVVTVPQPAAG